MDSWRRSFDLKTVEQMKKNNVKVNVFVTYLWWVLSDLEASWGSFGKANEVGSLLPLFSLWSLTSFNSSREIFAKLSDLLRTSLEAVIKETPIPNKARGELNWRKRCCSWKFNQNSFPIYLLIHLNVISIGLSSSWHIIYQNLFLFIPDLELNSKKLFLPSSFLLVCLSKLITSDTFMSWLEIIFVATQGQRLPEVLGFNPCRGLNSPLSDPQPDTMTISSLLPQVTANLVFLFLKNMPSQKQSLKFTLSVKLPNNCLIDWTYCSLIKLKDLTLNWLWAFFGDKTKLLSISSSLLCRT